MLVSKVFLYFFGAFSTYTGSYSQITCSTKPFTTMIIIIVNHHSFPVSQEPTRSNMEYFEHFPMAWSGNTVWNNWNNMQRMNTQSYWTITAVCWYCDNDVSLFSLCCCHNNWQSGPVSYMIQQQHHLVVGTGKVSNQQVEIKPDAPQGSGTCGKQ